MISWAAILLLTKLGLLVKVAAVAEAGDLAEAEVAAVGPEVAAVVVVVMAAVVVAAIGAGNH